MMWGDGHELGDTSLPYDRSVSKLTWQTRKRNLVLFSVSLASFSDHDPVFESASMLFYRDLLNP